jgi:hypothetical protein
MLGLPERHPHPPTPPAARLKEPKSKATCLRPRVRYTARGLFLFSFLQAAKGQSLLTPNKIARADIEGGSDHRRVEPSFGVRQPSKLSRYIR